MNTGKPQNHATDDPGERLDAQDGHRPIPFPEVIRRLLKTPPKPRKTPKAPPDKAK